MRLVSPALIWTQGWNVYLLGEDMKNLLNVYCFVNVFFCMMFLDWKCSILSVLNKVWSLNIAYCMLIIHLSVLILDMFDKCCGMFCEIVFLKKRMVYGCWQYSVADIHAVVHLCSYHYEFWRSTICSKLNCFFHFTGDKLNWIYHIMQQTAWWVI